MRALLQRVSKGAVSVGDNEIGSISRGLVILLGVQKKDTPDDAVWLAHKAAQLRIFDDERGHFDKSLIDIDGSALVIPQFTLFADASHGRRPSFFEAADPEVAAPLVDRFAAALREIGVRRVAEGEFGNHMQVEIHNDGPVTILLDSRK